jgi:hypothetical protein
MQLKTSHTAFVFLAAIFVLGYLDWLTTVAGLLCGGVELNPLLSGLTSSSIMVFSAAKLSAVAFAGFAAYKAADIAKHAKDNWRLASKLVNCGVLLTVLTLCVVVTNNVMVVAFKL